MGIGVMGRRLMGSAPVSGDESKAIHYCSGRSRSTSVHSVRRPGTAPLYAVQS